MKFIHFADLHLGVEAYGHVNPETGLSSRLEDFLRALDRLVDFAVTEKVDLVLFCGDAYMTREPSQTQQREFAKRIKRLSEAGIPLFMVTGNHDLPNALGRATATEIFDTLSVPNVYVVNKPGIHRIATRSGEVQIAALPWVRRSALLAREDTRNLDFTQINERLQQVLTGIISQQIAQIDAAVPAILAAHVWVLNAKLGTEKSMSIGQEHMLLLGSVASPVFDYVALGHIHKTQVLSECPPSVYSGSLERLDFGDQNEEKGFYLVEINTDPVTCQRKTIYQFHSIDARRFFTLHVDVQDTDLDPNAVIFLKIMDNLDKIKDAIVRLEISLPAALSTGLRDNEIRNLTKTAYFLNISREVRRETRLRLGRAAIEGITPEDALKAWLESKYSPERAQLLFAEGQKLIQEQVSKG
jgi:DNA repair protein SbcD/Mre11